MMPRIGPWYHGWNMVALGIVAVLVVTGSTAYAYGLFVTPVSKDLGLSRSTINSGLIFQHLGTAVMSPLVGRLLDRYSIRAIMLASAFMLGGSFAAMSYGDALLPKGLMLAFPISFAIAGAGTLASYVLVARWFRVNRGRAMAIVAIGQSGASVAYGPFLAWLIQSYGWRQALLWEGIGVFIVLVTISRLIGDGPGEQDVEPGSERLEGAARHSEHFGKPASVLSIVSRPIFWLLASIIGITLAVVQALMASIVPLATERGFSLVEAATLMSMLGISGVTGKLVLAFVADRVRRETLLVACLLVTLGFTLSLSRDMGYWAIGAGCLMSGMAIGTFFPIYSATLADRFGGNSLGTAEGLTTPVIAISASVAIHYAGQSHDATGSYSTAMLTFAAALGVALVLALLVRFGGRRADARPAIA